MQLVAFRLCLIAYLTWWILKHGDWLTLLSHWFWQSILVRRINEWKPHHWNVVQVMRKTYTACKPRIILHVRLIQLLLASFNRADSGAAKSKWWAEAGDWYVQPRYCDLYGYRIIPNLPLPPFKCQNHEFAPLVYWFSYVSHKSIASKLPLCYLKIW